MVSRSISVRVVFMTKPYRTIWTMGRGCGRVSLITPTTPEPHMTPTQTAAVSVPDTCCGLVECLGRTPAEWSGHCTRATRIYGLNNDLTEIARGLARAETRRDPRRAENLRRWAADQQAQFNSSAPRVIANLPACGQPGTAS